MAAAFLPGTLIGFSAHDLVGAAINLATWGVPFWGLSHVGVVANRPAQFPGDDPLLWESTGLVSEPCALFKRRVTGVQAHELAGRIPAYRGKVWAYPLRRGLNETQARRLTDLLFYYLGDSYDAIGALRCRETPLGWLERRLFRENLHSLFCSELVAAAWRAADVWSPPNASVWSPNHLARTALEVGIVAEPVRLK